MTTTQKSDAPCMMLSDPSFTTAIAGSLQELAKCQTEFENAFAEFQKHGEEIAKFTKARDAAKAAAAEVSAKIRAEFKMSGISTKDAVKLKSARNGHLDDAESFQMLTDELTAARLCSELAACRASAACFKARKLARSAAIEYLNEVLVQKLPPEYFMLIELTAEFVDSGDSVDFNMDSTVWTSIEFSQREVAKLINLKTKVRNFDQGSRLFLPPLPSSIDDFIKSPLGLKALADKVAAL